MRKRFRKRRSRLPTGVRRQKAYVSYRFLFPFVFRCKYPLFGVDGKGLRVGRIRRKVRFRTFRQKDNDKYLFLRKNRVKNERKGNFKFLAGLPDCHLPAAAGGPLLRRLHSGASGGSGYGRGDEPVPVSDPDQCLWGCILFQRFGDGHLESETLRGRIPDVVRLSAANDHPGGVAGGGLGPLYSVRRGVPEPDTDRPETDDTPLHGGTGKPVSSAEPRGAGRNSPEPV